MPHVIAILRPICYKKKDNASSWEGFECHTNCLSSVFVQIYYIYLSNRDAYDALNHLKICLLLDLSIVAKLSLEKSIDFWRMEPWRSTPIDSELTLLHIKLNPRLTSENGAFGEKQYYNRSSSKLYIINKSPIRTVLKVGYIVNVVCHYNSFTYIICNLFSNVIGFGYKLQCENLIYFCLLDALKNKFPSKSNHLYKQGNSIGQNKEALASFGVKGLRPNPPFPFFYIYVFQ